MKMKFKTIILIIFSVFFLCTVYTIIDSYPDYKSLYDLGYGTGYLFGSIMTILLPILIGMYLILKLVNRKKTKDLKSN